MRITAFIGAAVLGLCMLAFAPVAMADPAPDICVLDLSQPVTIEHAINTADASCVALVAVDVAYAVPIPAGADADDLAASMITVHAELLDFAGHRQHEDPGRGLI